MFGRQALGTRSPVDHLSLIDLITRIVGGGQARGVADGAVDVDGFSTAATDQVVVVVTDSHLVECRGAGGLDAPDDALVREDPERVIYGLSRYGTDVSTNVTGDVVGHAVGTTRHRPQHGQALSRDLKTVFSQQVGRIVLHGSVLSQSLD